MKTRSENALPESYRFSCVIEPRFKDLDPMGHVNNAVYFTYFEVARTGYVRDIGLRTDPRAPFTERFPFILLKIECQYFSAARVEDRLRVFMRTCRIGSKSFEFDYLIVTEADGSLVAQGHSVQVYYDYAQGKTLRIPDELRQLLIEFEGSERIETV